MQNLKTHILKFHHIRAKDHTWIMEYVQALNTLNKVLIETPLKDDYDYTHIEWEPPYCKPLHSDYHMVLCYLARFVKVKLMWRSKLTPEGTNITKVIWIIGSTSRVKILEALLNTWYKSRFQTEQNIRSRETDYLNINKNIKDGLQSLDDTLITVLKHISVFDLSYDIKLKAYIKDRYNLDYKKYNTEVKRYAHTISNRFHHKRMLL